MKKSVLLFATASVLMTTVTFTACKPKEQTPKNYYGVQSDDNGGVNSDAYKAFGAIVLVLSILIAIGIKRLKKK